jgi:hypothetical protein
MLQSVSGAVPGPDDLCLVDVNVFAQLELLTGRHGRHPVRRFHVLPAQKESEAGTGNGSGVQSRRGTALTKRSRSRTREVPKYAPADLVDRYPQALVLTLICLTRWSLVRSPLISSWWFSCRTSSLAWLSSFPSFLQLSSRDLAVPLPIDAAVARLPSHGASSH